ncbi:MAG: glycoside hydrolase family 88 protein [Miniphocaeibacter sp.]|uniref:glycoside hydrolase family 88/105 protein n=1 Tax=Miniphocaeibacter sp. TaxID=3100973 RepID=UPI001799EB98|nr:glycosyl hydrolase family 88 [Gallicola sp.]
MKEIKNFFDGLLEKTTPSSPKWDKEMEKGNIEPKWSYINGCMVIAALYMFDATGDNKYFEFADNFIDYYIDDDGKILGYNIDDYNSDSINEGKTLFKLYDLTGKEKYKKALDLLYSQLENHPRIKSGNFWHKKIYPNQVWLDGLYMVQPFLLEYINRYKNGEGYEDVINQFKNVNKFMKDEKTGLYYHGYDESRESFWADKETGLSENFWTRSIGWYTMALIDVLEILDEDLIEERLLLKGYFRELIDSLLKYADEKTGMFYQATIYGGREGNYLETSGSCAISYSIMKGARLGYLPKEYFEKGKRILNSVVNNKLVKENDEYILKDICLIAGLGGMPGMGDYKIRDGKYEYYISEPIVENDAKGISTLVYAYSELIRENK